MTTKHALLMTLFLSSVVFALVPTAQATISLDRTRIVFPGNTPSLTLNVINKDLAVPYQAQAWLEDAQGAKLNDKSDFVIIPAVQNIEPGGKAQLRIQAMPVTSDLPQDQETLFYLNLLEVPPKSGKDNVVQINLQTRIKMFYRPEALIMKQQMMPFQKELTLTKSGTSYIINNSTPYFISLATASVSATKGRNAAQVFDPYVIPPKSSVRLAGKISELGDAPVLVYVNDYGDQISLTFHCTGTTCKVDDKKPGD